MLQFFRRHQKVFFIVTTTVVVSSFIFFGTYQVFSPSFKRSDEVFLHTSDGKKITKSYFQTLVHLLDYEASSGNFAYQKNENDFTFNEGLISKDFLETGVAKEIFSRQSPEEKETLEKKFLHEKIFAPYAHPSAPFLSAKAVWSLFAPEIPEQLAKWQSCEHGSDPVALETKIKLYLIQRQFPPSLLTQILRYQLKETPGVSIDPRLYRDELSLFGYKTLSDWFGPSFVPTIAKIMLEGAAEARQKGLKVKREEALADLLVRFQRAQGESKQGAPSSANASQLFERFCRAHYVESELLVSVWQEVLLYKKMIESSGSLPLFDPLALNKFFSEAGEFVSVDILHMASEYQLKDKKDLENFEAYLSAVSAHRSQLLEIPLTLDPLQEVEKRAPELVGSRFILDIAKVSKKELEAKITVKETWEWESKEENWSLLTEQFPELKTSRDLTDEQRLDWLNGLDKKTRTLVDRFACKKIVESHPEWVNEKLSLAKFEEHDLFLCKRQGAVAGLEGIQDGGELRLLFQESDLLNRYSQDEQNFYRIKVKQRSDENEILSFQQAKERGALSRFVADCQPVMNALSQFLQSRGIAVSETTAEAKADALARYRFAPFLAANPQGNALWKVVCKKDVIHRGSTSALSFEEASGLPAGTLSSLKVSSELGAHVYRIVDRQHNPTPPLEKYFLSQKLLSEEAKRHMLKQFLIKLSDQGLLQAGEAKNV